MNLLLNINTINRKRFSILWRSKKKLNDFNKLYFIFSPICLKAILENLGFKIIISEKTKLFNNLRFPRLIIYAKKLFKIY